MSAECRKAGIVLEKLPEEIGRVGDLVREGKMDAALAHMRELKLEILARLVLEGPEETPPAPVENVSRPSPASAGIRSAIRKRLAKDTSPPAKPKPHR